MNLRGIAATIFLLLVLSESRLAADVSGIIDFNSPNDFNKFNILPSNAYTEATADGAGGTGGVSLVTSQKFPGASLTYNQQSFRYSDPSDRVALSIMFHYKDVVPVSGQSVFPISISLWADSTPSVSNGLSTKFIISLPQGFPIRYDLDTFSYQANVGNGAGFHFSDLTDDHWYRLSTTFSFANVAGTELNHFDVTMEDFGTSGTNLSAVIFNQSFNSTSLMPVFSDSTAWASFAMDEDQGLGNVASDNFTFAYVPEPSTFVLAALGGLALLALRKRRAV